MSSENPDSISFFPWSTKDNGVLISFVRLSEAGVLLAIAGISELDCLIFPALVVFAGSCLTQWVATPYVQETVEYGELNIHHKGRPGDRKYGKHSLRNPTNRY